MIVEFRVANFRSIKDEQILSFVPDDDARGSDELLPTGRSDEPGLVPALFVYGANASGKSNLFSALQVLVNLTQKSGPHMTLGDKFEVIEPFRLDPACREGATRFAIKLVVNDVLYEYVLHCTKSQVVFEKLTEKRNVRSARPVRVFERAGVERPVWKSDRERLDERFFESVRPNATALSRAAMDNVAAVRPVFETIIGITFRSMASLPGDLLSEAHQACQSDASMESFIARAVSLADIPITGVRFDTQKGLDDLFFNRIEEPNVSDPKPDGGSSIINIETIDSAWIKGVTEQVRILKGRLAETKNIAKIYGSRYLEMSLIRQDSSGLMVSFSLAEESEGTKRFIALILAIYNALKTGSVLILDEYDASLHSLLATLVRDLLNQTDLNPKGAQFVAITHTDALLRDGALRRDQVVIVEKNPATQGSEWFALSDLRPKPRPDEAFQARYLRGAYGGVPQIGNLRSLFIEHLFPELDRTALSPENETAESGAASG